MSDRDIQLVEHMIRYCNEIMGTVRYFGNSKSAFLENILYTENTKLSVLQFPLQAPTDGF